MRRIDNCINCGNERELVSHGLCARCYMGQRREAEKRDEPAWANPDRSQRRYIAERNKMLVNLTRIVKIVDETPCLSPEDGLAIKTVIRPYLLERAESLAPKPGVNTLTSKSELTPTDATRVKRLTRQEELRVNSDEATKAPKKNEEKRSIKDARLSRSKKESAAYRGASTKVQKLIDRCRESDSDYFTDGQYKAALHEIKEDMLARPLFFSEPKHTRLLNFWRDVEGRAEAAMRTRRENEERHERDRERNEAESIEEVL